MFAAFSDEQPSWRLFEGTIQPNGRICPACVYKSSMAMRRLIGRPGNSSANSIASGKISSDLESFVSWTKLHLKFGMQFSPLDSKWIPEPFVGLTPQVRTTALKRKAVFKIPCRISIIENIYIIAPR
jgi:hypothetical protein